MLHSRKKIVWGNNLKNKINLKKEYSDLKPYPLYLSGLFHIIDKEILVSMLPESKSFFTVLS